MTQLKTKKVNFLLCQQFHLNFAVFLSNFIKKTYILLNLIHYYHKIKFWGEIIRFTIIPNRKWNHCSLPRYGYDFIFIKEVDTTNGVLYLVGGWGGGEQCHTRLLVLGEGGLGKGVEVTRNIYFLLLTYLRPVLIFIKQYSNSMCFSSIFSWKLRIIHYLCEIDVHTPTFFLVLIKIN